MLNRGAISLQVLTNEYYYKWIIVCLGICYWIYGLMPSFELVMKVIDVAAVLPIAYLLINDNKSLFIKIVYFCMCGSFLITLLLCANKPVTTIIFLYITIEVVLLTYCDSNKTEQTITKELNSIIKMILVLSVVIVFGSLLTYFLKISHEYFYLSIMESHLILGIDEDTGALVGIFSNANAFSSFLVVTLGCLLYYPVSKKRYQLFKEGYIVLILITLFLTRSRGGLIGACVVLAAFVLWQLTKRVHKKADIIVLIIIVLFVVCACIAFIIYSGIDINSMTGREASEMSGSTTSRLVLWRAAIKAITNNPIVFLFGYGAGFHEIVASYIDSYLPMKLFGNLHNIYIQTLMVFGALGLTFFLIVLCRLVFGGLKMIVNNYKENEDMIMLVGMLVALMVINLVESDMYMGKTFLSTVLWVIGGYTYNIMLLRARV